MRSGAEKSNFGFTSGGGPGGQDPHKLPIFRPSPGGIIVLTPAHSFARTHARHRDRNRNRFPGWTHPPTSNIYIHTGKLNTSIHIYIHTYVHTCKTVSVSGSCGRKGPNNPETDWDDNPGKPRLIIPIRFGVFCPNRAKKPRN